MNLTSMLMYQRDTRASAKGELKTPITVERQLVPAGTSCSNLAGYHAQLIRMLLQGLQGVTDQ